MTAQLPVRRSSFAGLGDLTDDEDGDVGDAPSCPMSKLPTMHTKKNKLHDRINGNASDTQLMTDSSEEDSQQAAHQQQQQTPASTTTASTAPDVPSPESLGYGNGVKVKVQTQERQPLVRRTSNATLSTHSSLAGLSECDEDDGVGLSSDITKTIQPYHVVFDQEFNIVQVGNSLPNVLKMSEDDLVGQCVTDILEVTKPMGMDWNWNWLNMVEDQAFEVEPIVDSASSLLKFQTTVVHVSHFPPMAMLLMTPQANNLGDLREMHLTLSDLPVHGAHRDAIFLREHMSAQLNQALRMEKLSKSLEREKTLLESLLPTHAAEGLRHGKSVEPRMHQQVTMFFSDIVGFTSICDKIYPWDVIQMLNRLYCVMDHLSIKFNLYKVETIGDAYVAASGLPEADPNHAKNVANFALAVQHCMKLVLSPVDNKTPIQLRIGVHTGPCASGIVGMTNPRYCVFGDTVNTTARHESSGVPGMIHMSCQTDKALRANHEDMFKSTERGMIAMKGKGELKTYFLQSSTMVNDDLFLKKLEAEIKGLLDKYDFDATPERRKCDIDQSAVNASLNASWHASGHSTGKMSCNSCQGHSTRRTHGRTSSCASEKGGSSSLRGPMQGCGRSLSPNRPRRKLSRSNSDPMDASAGLKGVIADIIDTVEHDLTEMVEKSEHSSFLDLESVYDSSFSTLDACSRHSTSTITKQQTEEPPALAPASSKAPASSVEHGAEELPGLVSANSQSSASSSSSGSDDDEVPEQSGRATRGRKPSFTIPVSHELSEVSAGSKKFSQAKADYFYFM